MDAKTDQQYSNRLIHEISPYLLQHAHNPVDWYPWGDEALKRAKDEDKPILVSIGYSACHWCHVMEHESFEDQEVARVMNALFVCIKVDREERPDLDKIYQTAHQLLTQRAGGWPLNMFLTPDDRAPFFGGTYFPKEPRHGMPAFTDVLRRVSNYYHEHRDDIERQNEAVRDAFVQIQPGAPQPGLAIQPAVLDAARNELGTQYDATNGGFGDAPKFPHQTSLERLLRHWAASWQRGAPDHAALGIVQHTLKAMANGGIYDQVGGGFCRYSVDAQWMIPHFEKMLYDNGPLLALYTDATMATSDDDFRQVAIDTGEWVLSEMQSREGGYYSTLDADSEGHEGKFYVWSRDEAQSLLTPDEYRAVAARFGLERSANFEGQWHLHGFADVGTVAQRLGMHEGTVRGLLLTARTKLFDARERRMHPGRDEKILTSWNGLMIKGMARAGRYFDRPDFVASATRALDFIKARLYRDGRLLATYKDGRAHLNAYLDDYALLIDGILELLQARWRTEDLTLAVELADTLLDHFEDKENGAFFFTSDDHEKLVYRPKPASDESIPAGNGIAAQVLLRLGHLLGNVRYLDAAERTIKALYPAVQRYPSAHNALLNAVEEYLESPQTIVVRGDANLAQPWMVRCRQDYAPRRLVIAIPDDNIDLPGALAQRKPSSGIVAYVCAGHNCSAPVHFLADLEPALRATGILSGPAR